MSKKVMIKSIHAEKNLNEPIEYGKSFSRGVSVNCGQVTFLFISGTASIDKDGNTYAVGNFTAQAKRTFDNISALLETEKASWRDVVKTTCYLKSMKYYDEFNEYRNLFYGKMKLVPFPASVCVEAGLCRKELLVEIDATVVMNRKRK